MIYWLAMNTTLGLKLAVGLFWLVRKPLWLCTSSLHSPISTNRIIDSILAQTAQSSAYSFDKSCQGTDLDNAKAAASEAIKVLQYAQDRIRWQAVRSPPAPYDGTLLQDMMGSNDAAIWQNTKSTFWTPPLVRMLMASRYPSSLVQCRYKTSRTIQCRRRWESTNLL